MKKLLSRFVETVAKIIPLWFYPLLVRRISMDVFYHAVSDDLMAHVRHLYSVVPQAKFESALGYLKAHYQFASYQQLHAHRIDGAPLPKKSVHLSFDDGFLECFSIVRPLLLKYQIPCTFFVTIDWLDNRTMFYRHKISLCVEELRLNPDNRFLLKDLAPDVSAPDIVTRWLKALRLSDQILINEICRLLNVDWDAFLHENRPYLTRKQLRQMHAEGFTIGAHTKTHRKLVDLSNAEKETEIVESCRVIADITGQAVVPFSFPHSAFGIERDFLADLRAHNPNIGLLFDTKDLRHDENFIVNRVWAERPITPARNLRPLNEIFHTAYKNAWVEGVMGWGRRLRA